MKKDFLKQKELFERETKAFYDKVDSSRRIDTKFSVLPEGNVDEDLTPGEVDEINTFWGKYAFAYPNIDYNSFKTFKNRCGFFSAYHCPGAIRTQYFNKHFVDNNYSVALQNKAMFDILYPEINKPKTIVRRMRGLYYDSEYNCISVSEAVKICTDYVDEHGSIIIKPSGLGGGRGVTFIHRDNNSSAEIRKVFNVTLANIAFVVQGVLKQSEFTAKFNQTSLNTIRITSLLFKGKVHPLAALVRIGPQGSEIDNFSSGGSLLGIDINTGKCNSWAMKADNTKISVLPNGLDLAAQDLAVPSFDEVKRIISKIHYRIPYVKLISWDIALNEENVPTFIECNFAGMIQLHEAVTGPLFGDLMPELLDEYLLKEFFVRIAEKDFICKEFHDHITLIEYIGESENVVIPEEINGKPVTKIDEKAFKGCTISNFTAPLRLMKQANAALADHIKE